MKAHFRKWIIGVTLLLVETSFAFGAAALEPPDCTKHAAGSFELGVNRPNLAWETDWKPILDNIRTEFCFVRLNPNGDPEKAVETIAYARKIGLRVLLSIPLDIPKYYDPSVEPRPGNGKLRKAYPLSQLDLNRLRSSVTELISALDNTNTTVDVVEIGNEINWAPSNGDLPLFQTGVEFNSVDQMGSQANDIQEGMHRYVEAVKIVRDVVRASPHQKDAVILGAGLVRGFSNFAQRSGGTVVSPLLMNELGRKFGLQQVLDAYAIHIYPYVKEGEPQAEIKSAIDEAIKGCVLDGKPCYITEWGFPSEADSCPAEDPRNAEFQEFLSYLKSRQSAVKAAYLYDWDHSKGQSIFRCGRLLPRPEIFR